MDGVGTSSTFNSPTGIAVDSSGNVYIGDSRNDRVRIIFASAATAACDSAWHHVALTHGDGSPTATATYVDGALASTATQTLALPSDGYGVLSVGSNGLPTSTGLAQLFNGSLAELRLYNRSLTASEVFALSQPLLPVNPSPLVTSPTLRAGATSYAWQCAAGYFGGPATLTRSPVDGSWSSAGVPLSCAACPAGSYSAFGSSSCPVCAAGSYSSSPASPSCTLCSAGTFAPANSTRYTACPTNVSTPFSGSASVASCTVCAAGFAGVVTNAGTASAAGCAACAGGSDKLHCRRWPRFLGRRRNVSGLLQSA